MKTQTLNAPLFSRLPIAELSLLLTAIFWGTSYGITKEALIYTSVLAFIVIRFSLTSLLLLPNYWRDARKGLTTDWKYALPTGVILLCIFLAETYGIFHTTASKAAFLISLCVLMTPFVEAITTKQWPPKSIIGFALLSVVGVLLLTQKELGGSSLIPALKLNLGDYCILLAALLRACMVVSTQVLLKGKRLSALNITSIQANVVSVGALVIFLMSDIKMSDLVPMEWHFWLLAFYLVIFCTIFALFAQNYGVKHTTSSRVALLTGSEPAFGALFAFVWLGESLTVIQMIGGICILLATLMATMQGRKTRP
ncbi:DMT family transporter [Marinomonas colpomeniae]|uniref:DMT family transporter n=1 Tax=Marinomonas colpomeniae TaxID=2774408 RepID=A0ABR8NZP9_9GAMM|nr:DMT family transporter [Marinomonas colpomeniae]MBD5771525.1 DMT family transporter [Marinomonas colpomeniae]